MNYLARHDTLTGLSNRQYALKKIKYSLKDRSVTGKKYALMLFDLDFFKKANDSYGHIFGDRVLKEVARKLKESTRQTDTVARIGGDEFLLFMEYYEDATPLVERLFQAVGGRYEGFEIQASMGIALAPRDGTTYEELFHRADQALYAAKQEGRKGYRYYNDSMEDLLSVLSPVEGEIQD